MIKAIPHKKTIFIFTVLNICGYDKDNGKPFHPLRLKVRQDLAKYTNRPNLVKFREEFNKNERQIHPYVFAQVAIQTNDEFAIEDESLWGTNHNFISRYRESFERLFTEIYKEIEFDDYYQTTYFPEYKVLIDQVQQFVNGYDLDRIILDFWKPETEPKFIIVPNPLIEVHRGFSVEDRGTIFSIIGPDYSKQNDDIRFTKDRIVHTSVHELSHPLGHSLIDKLLSDNQLEEQATKILEAAKLQLRSNPNSFDFTKGYNHPSVYIEENLIRAVTLLLRVRISSSISEEARQAYLSNQVDRNNMILVEDFYRALESDFANIQEAVASVIKDY